MSQYEAYKDSDIEWIGEIPSHWEVQRNKNFLSERKDTVGKKSNEFTLLSLTKNGVIIRNLEEGKGKFPAEFDSYKIVSPGNIIFCLFDMDETPRTVGLSSHYGMITGAYDVFNIHGINASFLTYLYLNIDDRKALKPLYRSLRKVIPVQSFLSANLPVPPLAEQEAIATYLDEKCAEFDKAVEQQQRMIDLLAERKRIIISHAVTRGLNPDAPLRDSGIQWLGQIPEHWEVGPLKRYLKSPMQYGANESAEFDNSDWPRYIRITDIDMDGRLKTETFKSLPPEKAKDYILGKGDVLFSRSGATVGKTFLFDENIQACFAGYLIKASCKDNLYPNFLIHYTHSGQYENWKNHSFIQATIQNIGADKYKNLPIPLPPLAEQEAIAAYLDEQCASIDKAIEQKRRLIELIQERKQIMINNVVTGKIKVS